MNKAEFVQKLATQTKFTKVQTENFLDLTLSMIKSSVAEGEDIKFVGFGTFDRVKRQARNGRNPKTGEALVIPATELPRFRPGKDFKQCLKLPSE